MVASAVPSPPPWFHEIFNSSWFPLALRPESSDAVSLFPYIYSYSPAESFLWFSPKRTHSHKASGVLGSFPREFKGNREGPMVHYTLLVILSALSFLSFPPSPHRPYSVFTVVIARLGSHRKCGQSGLSVPPLTQHITCFPCTFFESQWTLICPWFTGILCSWVLPSSHANRVQESTDTLHKYVFSCLPGPYWQSTSSKTFSY